MGFILFCEDDYYQVKPGVKGLRERFPEHEVISTYTVKDSLERVVSCLDDLMLVITDGNLHWVENGWDLAKELRRLGYEGPIIYRGLSEIPPDMEGLFTTIYGKSLGTPKELTETFAWIAEKHIK